MTDNMRAIDAILANGTPHRFGLVGDNLEEMSAPVAALVQRLQPLAAAGHGPCHWRRFGTFPAVLRQGGRAGGGASGPGHRPGLVARVSALLRFAG